MTGVMTLRSAQLILRLRSVAFFFLIDDGVWRILFNADFGVFVGLP